jgi:hypothetical protein
MSSNWKEQKKLRKGDEGQEGGGERRMLGNRTQKETNISMFL